MAVTYSSEIEVGDVTALAWIEGANLELINCVVVDACASPRRIFSHGTVRGSLAAITSGRCANDHSFSSFDTKSIIAQNAFTAFEV